MNFDAPIAAEQPDLSVVVPYYNQPEQLDRALGCLLAQRDLHLEALVIDDASDKSCKEVIERRSRQGLPVTLLRQKVRSYTLKGRLLGMNRARGRWLAFMDADDELAGDTVLSEAIHAADRERVDILHFRVLAMNKDGFLSHWPYAAPFYHGRLEGPDIFSTWLNKACPAHSVWNKLYSRALYTKICALDHPMHIWRIEDFYLSAHFLFFAASYASHDTLTYIYYLPAGTHLAKAAGRAFDALHMYLHFPARFHAFGLDETLCHKLQAYLRALVTLNGGRMCLFMDENIWKFKPFVLNEEAPAMQTVLQYGDKKNLLSLLAIANASNVRKLRDLNGIINK